MNYRDILKPIYCRAYLALMRDIGDTSDAILLAGLGRSGTTWVSNTINPNHDFRYIFEPFNRVRHCQCKQIDFLDFHCHLYIRPESHSPERNEVARKILSGELKDLVFDFENAQSFLQGKRKLKFSKRIIKTICSNLFLKWINVNFREVPIILLMRHPIPVFLSRQVSWGRQGVIDEQYPFRTYLNKRPELLEDHLYPFQDYLEGLQDPFEVSVANWCIQHYVPLRQFEKGDIYVAFYENLCLNPETEFKKIYEYLNIQGVNVFPENFDKAYAATSIREQEIKAGNKLKDWRTAITGQQLKKALDILDRFQLTAIYTDDLKPNCNDASVIADKFRVG